MPPHVRSRSSGDFSSPSRSALLNCASLKASRQPSGASQEPSGASQKPSGASGKRTGKVGLNNPDFGEFNEELDIDFDGAPIKVAFNLKYFQDILNAVDGDFLSLELGDVLDPCIVKLSNRTDCQFVIMPMRLN